MPRKAKSLERAARRAPVNMRMTDEVRKKLERAAIKSGRPLVQEVEWRIQTSLREDQDFGEWADFYKFVRDYLKSIAILRDKNGAAVDEALKVGFGLLIDAFCSGVLSDDRIREVQLDTTDELADRGGPNAVMIAYGALDVLSRYGLAFPDSRKLAVWLKERGNAR
jgi:hypothetical protein